jgi:hypothetical protein
MLLASVQIIRTCRAGRVPWTGDRQPLFFTAKPARERSEGTPSSITSFVLMPPGYLLLFEPQRHREHKEPTKLYVVLYRRGHSALKEHEGYSSGLG